MSRELDPDEQAVTGFVSEFRARHPELYNSSDRSEKATVGASSDVDDQWGLDGEQTEFLHGKCHLLAVALHELTGLPMGAYLDEALVEKNGEDVEMVVLLHAFVVDGDDAIDMRGRVPIEDVLTGEFDFNDPWFVNPTSADLFSLGEGRKDVSRRNPRYVEALRHAEALVERLQLPSASDVGSTSPPPGVASC